MRTASAAAPGRGGTRPRRAARRSRRPTWGWTPAWRSSGNRSTRTGPTTACWASRRARRSPRCSACRAPPPRPFASPCSSRASCRETPASSRSSERSMRRRRDASLCPRSTCSARPTSSSRRPPRAGWPTASSRHSSLRTTAATPSSRRPSCVRRSKGLWADRAPQRRRRRRRRSPQRHRRRLRRSRARRVPLTRAALLRRTRRRLLRLNRSARKGS